MNIRDLKRDLKRSVKKAHGWGVNIHYMGLSFAPNEDGIFQVKARGHEKYPSLCLLGSSIIGYKPVVAQSMNAVFAEKHEIDLVDGFAIEHGFHYSDTDWEETPIGAFKEKFVKIGWEIGREIRKEGIYNLKHKGSA